MGQDAKAKNGDYNQQECIEPLDYLLKSTKTQNLNLVNQFDDVDTKQNFSQMINDIPSKISCFSINLKPKADSTNFLTSLSKPNMHHSYSIVFMLRFDSDFIRFATSYGLNNGKTSESYAHVLSQNLNNQASYYEIWLNSNGNLLFM